MWESPNGGPGRACCWSGRGGGLAVVLAGVVWGGRVGACGGGWSCWSPRTVARGGLAVCRVVSAAWRCCCRLWVELLPFLVGCLSARMSVVRVCLCVQARARRDVRTDERIT